MASLRTGTPRDGGQGIIDIFKITAVVTGDTFAYKNNVVGWWVTNRTTSDAIGVSYSAATQLFTITVANTPDIDLYIMGAA